MTQVGQEYRGIWPEYPIKDPQEGQTVRYPLAGGGEIARGTIAQITGKSKKLAAVVHFTNGDWCYTSEVGEDRD